MYGLLVEKCDQYSCNHSVVLVYLRRYWCTIVLSKFILRSYQHYPCLSCITTLHFVSINGQLVLLCFSNQVYLTIIPFHFLFA